MSAGAATLAVAVAAALPAFLDSTIPGEFCEGSLHIAADVSLHGNYEEGVIHGQLLTCTDLAALHLSA